jgi:hypothetical protein
LDSDFESPFPPFVIYRQKKKLFSAKEPKWELFKPSTFGSAQKMSSGVNAHKGTLLIRSELCYPVRTPMDIWHAKAKGKSPKPPKPKDPIFHRHWRVYLTDEDHKGLKASIYDFDKKSVPSKKNFELVAKDVKDRHARA